MQNQVVCKVTIPLIKQTQDTFLQSIIVAVYDYLHAHNNVVLLCTIDNIAVLSMPALVSEP